MPAETKATEAAPSDDIRSLVESAFEADMKSQTESDAKPDKKPAPSEDRRDAKPEAKLDAKPEAKSDAKAEERSEQKAEEKADKSTAKAIEEVQKPKFREPPSRWTKEMKETWSKAFGALDDANPTHKQIGALRDMMFDAHAQGEAALKKAQDDFTAQKAQYDAFDRVIAPRRAAIEAAGSTAEKAVAELFQLNDYATTRPEEFVRWFMQGRGLDPAKVFGLQPSGQQAAPNAGSDLDMDDPLDLIPKPYKDAIKLVPQLQAQIADMSKQFGSLSGNIQQQDDARRRAETANAAKFIADWAAEKDQSGNLKRPFYEDVKPAVISMLEAGHAKTLDDAYDAAVWANPTTRARMLDSQAAARIAEEERRAADTAARKAAAGVGVAGRSAALRPTSSEPKSDNLRDLIGSLWDSAERAGEVRM